MKNDTPQEILAVAMEALGEPGDIAPPVAERPTPRPLENSLHLYVKDLEDLRLEFENLVARGAKPRRKRDRVEDLSKRFTENLTGVQRATTRLSALLEIATDLMVERDPARLVELFFLAARDLIDSSYAAVGVLDENGRDIRYAFAKGFDAQIVRGEVGRTGLLGSLLSGESVHRARVEDTALANGHPPVRDLLGTPVASADRIHGWIYFADSRDEDGFGEEDTRVANAMARMLALLYENAMFYTAIQRNAAQLQIDTDERGRAQEALVQSEERFRQMAENIRDVFILFDVATPRVLYVNSAYERIWGRSRESFYADPESYMEAIHSDDLANAREQYRQALTTGVLDFEYRVVRSDGEIRFLRVRGSPIHDDAGKLYRIIIVLEDITPRRRLGEEISQREATLRHAQFMAKLAHGITGPDGSFESWSETLLAMIGVEPAAMPRSAREWLNILHPDDRARWRKRAIEAAATGRRVDVDYRLRRADGAWLHIRQLMEPLGDQPDAQGKLRWLNALQDVTEQKQAEDKIRSLNRVYAVASGINSLIARAPGRDELFKETCRIAAEQGEFPLAWIAAVGQSEMNIEPVAWAGCAEGYLRQLRVALDAPAAGHAGFGAMTVREKTVQVANDIANDPRIRSNKEALEHGFHSMAVLPLMARGEVVALLSLYSEETGFFDAGEMKLLRELAGNISFALEHIEKEKKLDYLANYDPLTGLANRGLFHDRLTQQVLAAQRAHSKLAVVFLDLDRFKMVNDSLGRQAGDSLLKQVADRITRQLPDPNDVARVGADQFSIAVPDMERESDLVQLIEKERRNVFDEPFDLESSDLRVSAKIGVAVYPDDGADAETLLRNAEAAGKRAKRSGDEYLFYTQEMTARVAEKLELENKLRQALANEEFVLHYQPKVDLAKRGIVGVEALIRWQSPELGLVPPLRFISLLEETGLILPVGSWALHRAALDHRDWVERGLKAPRIAVNVSPIQLRQNDFVDVVEQAVARDVAPTGIDLEITESLIMEDVEGSIEKLEAVRSLGLGIAIDDFGTGYSSLAYLIKLPVETLKIDRTFVITMLDDPNTLTLVQTMISLAHSLRLKVVAEGVESEEQAKLLRLLRCDQMQGYLFSRPMPVTELTAMLQPRS